MHADLSLRSFAMYGLGMPRHNLVEICVKELSFCGDMYKISLPRTHTPCIFVQCTY